MPIFTVPIIVALGLLVLLTRWENQHGYEQFERAISTTMAGCGLREKAHPHFRSWRALGLVRYEARTEECDRLRHLVITDLRMFGVMRVLNLCVIPDYCYNLPIFVGDVVFLGPSRMMALEVIDPVKIPAAHLQRGYRVFRQCRSQFASVLPLRNDESTPWAGDMLQDFSLVVGTDHRQDQQLLQLFQIYLTTWLDMAREAPPLAPEMQPKVQAAIDQYVDRLLEHGGPAVNFERRVIGPKRSRRWIRTVVFGLAA